MGWFANLVFGKAKSVQSPVPPDHSAWGVDKNDIPNIAEQKVEPQEHDEVTPELHFVRLEQHPSHNGDYLELWACIQNNSNTEVEVTRIDCFGQNVQPSQFLRAGENRELKIYGGPMFANDAQQKAGVTYKSINSGDYYEADYIIKYRYSLHGGANYCLPYEIDFLQANMMS